MAEQKLNTKIPQQSLIYLGLCLTGVLIFLFLGIIPAYMTLAEMEAKASSIKLRIEEQKVLLPLYKTLQNISEQKDSSLLPLPERSKLAHDKIDSLPVTLNAVAKMNGMTLVSANPNVNALMGNAQLISVNLVLRGRFINFRKLLINLGSIPYVDRIEEIVIQGKADAKEYRLKLWVAIG